jgi:UDP-N-acetylglucosamine 2-epimerase (non-hydrolysing)
MKMMIVVGARPNFMKAAPILRAVSAKRQTAPAITPVLVHTGQHYDASMSDIFFKDLDLPHPDVYLGVGPGSHAFQTAEIMRKFEAVLKAEGPDVVVVVGDVNSTLACALVTAKISLDSTGRRPLLAHVEAGLRSFDRSMPEECNRVLTDHLSDLLFVTEPSGTQNLENEGIPSDRIYFVGNTMIDSLRTYEKKADQSSILQRLGLREATGRSDGEGYTVLTLHRPANVDDRNTFVEILEGLQEVGQRIIFPAHPRTQMRIQQHRLESYFECKGGSHGGNRPAAIKMIDPLGYIDFLCLMKRASLVITDSGGIQEETTYLGAPCVTVRGNTERPITVSMGTNVLAGTDRDSICQAIRKQRAHVGKVAIPELWDGKAADRIVEILLQDAHPCDGAANALSVAR